MNAEQLELVTQYTGGPPPRPATQRRRTALYALAVVRMHRLAELLDVEHERRERLGELLEDVGPLIRRLARLDQPQPGGRPGNRSQPRLLSRDELLHHIRQLAHDHEASPPDRTDDIPW